MMPGKGLRLLIVEDQGLMAMSIATVVLGLHYDLVGSARTAERALELAETRQPNVVLMDVQLKDTDSVSTAKAIMACSRSQIVFLTNAADSESIARMHAIKPAGIVLKPFRRSDLAAKLTTAARLSALAED